MQLVAKPLAGAFVRLEPIGARHMAGLRAAADDASLWDWMPLKLSGDEFEDGWSKLAPEFERPDRITFVVLWAASGEVAGSTSFLAIDPRNRRAEIGWTWYAARFHGSAVNPECKKLMLGHAFACGAERVEFKTDAENARSRAALKKLGAVEEGALRRHMIRPDGTFRDSVYYSILKEEWPSARAGLDRRLDAFEAA